LDYHDVLPSIFIPLLDKVTFRIARERHLPAPIVRSFSNAI
jgi:hypothetical protein